MKMSWKTTVRLLKQYLLRMSIAYCETPSFRLWPLQITRSCTIHLKLLALRKIRLSGCPSQLSHYERVRHLVRSGFVKPLKCRLTRHTYFSARGWSLGANAPNNPINFQRVNWKFLLKSCLPSRPSSASDPKKYSDVLFAQKIIRELDGSTLSNFEDWS